MIKDIAFVAYPVRDIPTAVAFYRDVLGLELGEPFGENYVEFNVGSTVFAVDSEPPLVYEPGTCSGVHFEVENISAAREHLFKNNVDVSKIHEFPTCSVCFAKDPEGNSFALHQRKNIT